VVTGAAGFVGGAIAHALRQRGYEVVALDVVRAPGVLVGDVCRPGDWEKELAGADLLVHAAAVGMGGVGELPPIRQGRPVGSARVSADRLRQVVLGGTAGVIDAAARAGVGRVVHISCVSALGPDLRAGADESAPVGLTGDRRADTLAAAEQAVSAAVAGGLPATVLRLGDAYGPRAGRWTLWPILLLRSGRFVLVDGGVGRLSPVYVDDIVEALLATVATDATLGETLHVAGPAPSTVADFVGHYTRMLELSAPRSVPARVYGAMDDAVEAVGRLRGLLDARRGPGAPTPAPPLSSAGVTGRAPGLGTTGGLDTSGGPGRSVGPAASADAATGSAAGSRSGPAALARGIGARLAAGVDPRGRMDLGPLTVADVTRSETWSASRIGELTGWRPTVDLTAGMERTEQWLRERGLLGVREPSRRG
jgi:nucleoside-diphosphate-sugar epimerase